MLSIAIALLAITSLTEKRWLYYCGNVSIAFGILMGLAELLNWSIHPDWMIQLLS